MCTWSKARVTLGGWLLPVHEAAVATFDALIAPTCTVLIFGSMRFLETKALLRCKTLTVHGPSVVHAPCLHLIAADCVHVRPGATITVTDDFHISGKCRIKLSSQAPPCPWAHAGTQAVAPCLRP